MGHLSPPPYALNWPALGPQTGGMKGLPLANRWPYTDGSVELVTSGESAKLFQKHLNSFRMDGLI